MNHLESKNISFKQIRSEGKSYLLLEIPEIKESSIIYYQAEMIRKNLSQVICDMNISVIEHCLNIIYNTDGKTPLAELCSRRKLEIQELIILIRNIIRVILRAERYFINPLNFLLCKETVYINTENLEASLVCLPLELPDTKNIDNINSDKAILEDILSLLDCIGYSVYDDNSRELAEILYGPFVSDKSHKNLNDTSISEVLQRLNNYSLQPVPEKNASPCEKQQLTIRQERKQDNMKENNNPANILYTKCVIGQSVSCLFKLVRSLFKKNKALMCSLFITQITAVVLMVILQKPIHDINPDGTVLTYGLCGLILAGIDTLILRKITG